MKSDGIKVKGHLEIILNNKVVRSIDNLVTTIGFAYLASIFGGVAVNQMEYIAVGTGATAPVIGNTALQTEIVRMLATVSVLTGSDSHKVVIEKYFAPSDIIATVTEAGILDSAVGGNLFNRATFTGVVVTAIDTFAVRWTISFLAS